MASFFFTVVILRHIKNRLLDIIELVLAKKEKEG